MFSGPRPCQRIQGKEQWFWPRKIEAMYLFTTVFKTLADVAEDHQCLRSPINQSDVWEQAVVARLRSAPPEGLSSLVIPLIGQATAPTDPGLSSAGRCERSLSVTVRTG